MFNIYCLKLWPAKPAPVEEIRDLPQVGRQHHLTKNNQPNYLGGKVMKKCFLFLFAILFMYSSMAFAVPDLPDGPIYIKFDNREQLSATGSIQSPSGTFSESNWGIFRVSTIATGDLGDNPQNFDPDTVFWTDLLTDGGSITGIFAGIELDGIAEGEGFYSTGGEIHFYYNEDGSPSLANALPASRTGDFQFTGFTDGTFLGAARFLNGAISEGNPNTSIVGDTIPTTGAFTGFANSYANININDGLWAPQLASQFFDSLLGPNTADLKLRNIYEGPLSAWDGVADDGTPIFGAQSSDPVRAFAVTPDAVIPEPSTLILFGSGLLGMAALGRRRFMKKS